MAQTRYYTGVTAGVQLSASSTSLTYISVNPTSAGKAYLVDGVDANGVKKMVFVAAANEHLGTGSGNAFFMYNGAYFLVTSGTWEVCITEE